jgi:hypothetical protein
MDGVDKNLSNLEKYVATSHAVVVVDHSYWVFPRLVSSVAVVAAVVTKLWFDSQPMMRMRMMKMIRIPSFHHVSSAVWRIRDVVVVIAVVWYRPTTWLSY